MPRNVEIKARVQDMDSLKEKAKKFAGDEGLSIVQEDTFFVTPKSRLKLRSLQGKKSQLISYCRQDQEGPKLSDFHVVEIDNPAELKTVLEHSLGIKGVVKKNRLLVMHGQTRIHLDVVEGLGDFMELEVQLKDDQTIEEGEKIALDIMESLGIDGSNLIDCAYMDMILNSNTDK